MASDYSRLLDVARGAEINPSSFLRPSMEAIDEAMENGFNVVTPNNPWLNLLEASSTMTVAAIEEANVLTRRQYRRMAQTEKDLYGHMSDRDFKGRFSKPGITTVNFAIGQNWLVDNAVYDSALDEFYLIIPKDTRWTVDGTDFYQHHDIKIHLLPSGDVQVYFVINRESPINTPTTLLVESITRYLEDGTKLLEIQIPVEQLSFEAYSAPVSSNGFIMSQTFTDKFYYARAFIETAGVWKEIKTTHSEQYYDPLVTTMTLEVTDNQIVAKIPDIYVNSGLAGTRARLVVYTTKGAIDLNLGEYGSESWSFEFDDIFDENTDYWENIPSAPYLLMYSRDKVTEGRDGLTFTELRDNVVYNGYGKQVAVTFEEMKIDMNSRGYGLYKVKDTISERVHVATKEIPAPASGFISSGPAVTNKDILIDHTRTDTGGYIVNNGDITTVKPGALLKSVGFDIALATEAERTALEALGTYDLCDKLNSENFFYTPFHYVLDATSPIFRSAAYYLSRPIRTNTSFVNFNDNLNYVINTTDVSITFNDDAYQLVVNCANPSGLTDIILQLIHTDVSGNRHHINSDQVVVNDTTSQFVFDIGTTLKIDSSNQIELTGFSDSFGTQEAIMVDLLKEFELVYLVKEATVTTSSFDSVTELVNITDTVSAVTYDKVSLQFGRHLKYLNTRSTAVVMPGEVKRYTTDKPLFWEKDVYAPNEDGTNFTVGEDGVVVRDLLHAAGDPMLDDNGDQKYAWRIGDPYVEDGKEVYESSSFTARRVRMFLIDAKYLFVSSPSIKEYADGIPDTVIEYLDDIRQYAGEVIERTSLLFEPTSTANSTIVSTSSGRMTSTFTAVKFDIEYVMDAARYADVQLRDAIQLSTKRAIATHIQKSEFSMSDLIRELGKVSDSIIRNVDVSTSLPDKLVKISEDSSMFSIKSRIVPTQNQQLTIEDDIAIEIVK